MEFPILIISTSPYLFEGMLGGIFQFIQILMEHSVNKHWRGLDLHCSFLAATLSFADSLCKQFSLDTNCFDLLKVLLKELYEKK